MVGLNPPISPKINGFGVDTKILRVNYVGPGFGDSGDFSSYKKNAFNYLSLNFAIICLTSASHKVSFV